MSVASEARRAKKVPPQTVVYAVGDIHGRLDLLEGVIEDLEAEFAEAAPVGKQVLCVFLGDYIDRGPDARGVISRLIALRKRHPEACIFLRGNHEQVLLDLLDGTETSARWLQFGGAETLRSYGLEPPAPGPSLDVGQLRRAVGEALPAAHLQFLRDTRLYAKLGDYLFVHAGLRPDRLVEEQSPADMLWYRYYEDAQPTHGEFVVHGHSPNPRPVLGRWRVGIDTEAYASGNLTALRMEGENREFLCVSRDEDRVRTSLWPGLDGAYRRPQRASGKPTRPAAQSRRSASQGRTAAPRSLSRKRRSQGPLIAAVAVLLALCAASVGVLVVRNSARVEAEPHAASPRTALPATVAEPTVRGVLGVRLVETEPAAPALAQPWKRLLAIRSLR